MCGSSYHKRTSKMYYYRKTREEKNRLQVASSVTHTKIKAEKCPTIWIRLLLRATNSILEAKPPLPPPLLTSCLRPCQYKAILAQDWWLRWTSPMNTYHGPPTLRNKLGVMSVTMTTGLLGSGFTVQWITASQTHRNKQLVGMRLLCEHSFQNNR